MCNEHSRALKRSQPEKTPPPPSDNSSSIQIVPTVPDSRQIGRDGWCSLKSSKPSDQKRVKQPAPLPSVSTSGLPQAQGGFLPDSGQLFRNPSVDGEPSFDIRDFVQTPPPLTPPQPPVQPVNNVKQETPSQSSPSERSSSSLSSSPSSPGFEVTKDRQSKYSYGTPEPRSPRVKAPSPLSSVESAIPQKPSAAHPCPTIVKKVITPMAKHSGASVPPLSNPFKEYHSPPRVQPPKSSSPTKFIGQSSNSEELNHLFPPAKHFDGSVHSTQSKIDCSVGLESAFINFSKNNPAFNSIDHECRKKLFNDVNKAWMTFNNEGKDFNSFTTSSSSSKQK